MSKLTRLKEQLNFLSHQILDLEKTDIIKNYKKLKSKHNDIKHNIEIETRLIQSECKHPIWYHLTTKCDEYEGRKYFTCKCLECNLIETRRAKDFNRKLTQKEDFITTKNKLKKLKNDLANNRNVKLNYDTVYNILSEMSTN